MHLEGTHFYPKKPAEGFRMTFTPSGSDRVVQHVEQSKDKGKTWYVWFHGTYTRRSAPVALKPKPRKPSKAGADAPHHQLDFWIGHWNATSAAGQVVGHNRIDSALSGRLLIENWSSTSGGGKSINYYDPGDKKWKQRWISAGGGLVWYEGEVKNGTMNYTGWHLHRNGTKTKARVFLKPVEQGRVHHRIEHWDEPNKAWKTYFDATYVPRK